MSNRREDYFFDPEKRGFAQGDEKMPVPYAKQLPIFCDCGFQGKIGDLGVPENDNEPLVCPQCLTAAWEYGAAKDGRL